MRLRAPHFWGRPVGPLALALAPLSALYGSVARARLARAAPRADLPTIAIGGLTLGGDGKTPTALALAETLLAMGERPAFLTRGYGRAGKSPGPIHVDPARHDARDVGDEALLLSGLAPTFVGADRAASAGLARAEGATVLILDDGLHSRSLQPDLAILVVDAGYGAGNGFCPPAGPLRAPLPAQLACADAVILIGEGEPPPWLPQAQDGASRPPRPRSRRRGATGRNPSLRLCRNRPPAKIRPQPRGGRRAGGGLALVSRPPCLFGRRARGARARGGAAFGAARHDGKGRAASWRGDRGRDAAGQAGIRSGGGARGAAGAPPCRDFAKRFARNVLTARATQKFRAKSQRSRSSSALSRCSRAAGLL